LPIRENKQKESKKHSSLTRRSVNEPEKGFIEFTQQYFIFF